MTAHWLLGAALLLTACHRMPRTRDEMLKEERNDPGNNAGRNHYDIKAPQGWIKKDSNVNGLYMTFVRDTALVGNFYPTVIIASYATDQSTAEYLDANLNHMIRTEGTHVIGEGVRTILGRKANWAHYITPNPRRGADLEGVLNVVKVGDVAYIIACDAASGHYGESSADFAGIMDSFSVE